MKKISGFLIALLAVVLLGACSSTEPVDTADGMNGLQQRVLTLRNIGNELDATYDDVWLGTITTLQLNGFILKQADKASGYIYGVWQNTYERQLEAGSGGLILIQAVTPPGITYGGFFSRTAVYKQIDVSVTLQPLARTSTQVRIVARFDNNGVPMAEGVFATRFFGLLRKEIFLRKNAGSVYWTAPIINK